VLQALAVRRSDRVLEIGTGSGYLTALLAHRAAQVFSVEIRPALAAFGKANIARHGVDNVTLEIGDGARGYAKWGPYDIVVLTGSVPLLPRALLDSLAPAGRAFAVVGAAPVMTAEIVTCTAPGGPDSFRRVELFETLLAPLANCEQPSRFTF
jgi:protein-L-isoaspartate(D-aspartate) O-methyltransferase